jgi:hypothetical protein
MLRMSTRSSVRPINQCRPKWISICWTTHNLDRACLDLPSRNLPLSHLQSTFVHQLKRCSRSVAAPFGSPTRDSDRAAPALVGNSIKALFRPISASDIKVASTEVANPIAPLMQRVVSDISIRTKPLRVDTGFQHMLVPLADWQLLAGANNLPLSSTI